MKKVEEGVFFRNKWRAGFFFFVRLTKYRPGKKRKYPRNERRKVA